MKSTCLSFFPFPLLIIALAGMITRSCTADQGETRDQAVVYPAQFSLSKAELLNKIKGGWAGQVIGCTYGGPTEFRFKGTMIQDYNPIAWDDTRMEWYYKNSPGLYDDVYMDLTFVDVFEKEGLDAPATSHAHAFANAGYQLWHANQAARYNILNGIEPPLSGTWENNPHADDIDFQIEADFAGLMNPGMVNSSSAVCDRVGHIMNYGDGWYGGVYVAAMYSLAFYSADVEFVVKEALRTIPAESDFYRCIDDVIHWHEEFPGDWKRSWFEVQKKWSSDIGCPDGVFDAFDIDAKVNAAYIVIGLLYGEGDFGKTLEISTRCGQDSDCNPASAGGILGAMIGYDRIPETWKQGLGKVEDMDFRYTTISLNDVYDMGFRHAIGMVKRNGGSEDDQNVTIPMESPVPVKFEKAFEGHVPLSTVPVGWGGTRLLKGGETEFSFGFSGIGFVVSGEARKISGTGGERDLMVEVYIDGERSEEVRLPTDYRARRHDVAWKYNLEDGEHQVKLIWENPEEGYTVEVSKVIIYGPC
jgi:hypothetical protein